MMRTGGASEHSRFRSASVRPGLTTADTLDQLRPAVGASSLWQLTQRRLRMAWISVLVGGGGAATQLPRVQAPAWPVAVLQAVPSATGTCPLHEVPPAGSQIPAVKQGFE